MPHVIENVEREIHSDHTLSPKKPEVKNMDASTRTSQNYSVIKRVSKSRFPVLQVRFPSDDQDYAMKLFIYKDGQPHGHYMNESRFAVLNHQNIVKMLSIETKKETVHENKTLQFSSILMEYAPYGDFLDLIRNHGNYFDEKLVRTYFRQLIDGIEYLHMNHICHLDLKNENLLLGSDFTLKIADFDSAYVEGDREFCGRGTKSSRAPEIFKSDSKVVLTKPFAADIYSAGIILFTMKSRRNPYFEDQLMDNVNALKLMNDSNKAFWKFHSNFQDKSVKFYIKEFKELFNGMTKENPSQRWTIKQIKNSKWYKGAVYNQAELKIKMNTILSSSK